VTHGEKRKRGRVSSGGMSGSFVTFHWQTEASARRGKREGKAGEASEIPESEQLKYPTADVQLAYLDADRCQDRWGDVGFSVRMGSWYGLDGRGRENKREMTHKVPSGKKAGRKRHQWISPQSVLCILNETRGDLMDSPPENSPQNDRRSSRSFALLAILGITKTVDMALYAPRTEGSVVRGGTGDVQWRCVWDQYAMSPQRRRLTNNALGLRV